MIRTKLYALLFALCLLPLPVIAAEWITCPVDEPAKDTGYLVNEYTGKVTITFLGDCTLGGETTSLGRANGYVRTVNREGFAYPFRNLLTLTAADDLTIANLEGVLSDRELEKVDKEFNFIGPADFAKILTEGSIDCVTLANNHSHDFGEAGYADTKRALEAEGITYFGSDCLAVWDWNGLLIGFTGATASGTKLERNVEQLWRMGCCAVIVYMHAGQENTGSIVSRQREIARQAAELGCSLVVGSHPHVVQGYEVFDGMPVVYSLGNCSFGGNHNPDDKDALVLQVDLLFEEGAPAGCDLHFYPISVTGRGDRNDFSPVLLTGIGAQRVLDKMVASTGLALPVFDGQEGAVLHFDIQERD